MDMVRIRCDAVVDVVAVRSDLLETAMRGFSPPTVRGSEGVTVVAHDTVGWAAMRPKGWAYSAIAVDCTELGRGSMCSSPSAVAQFSRVLRTNGALTHRVWDKAERRRLGSLYSKHFRNVSFMLFDRGGRGGFVSATGRN